MDASVSAANKGEQSIMSGSQETQKQHDILSNGVTNVLALQNNEDEMDNTTCEHPDQQEYFMEYQTPL